MMELVEFTKCLKDITGGNVKVKQSEYIEKGLYPVVDQGKKLIGGYTDKCDIVERNDAVIIFGDHTGIIKYIDFDFVLGADGVKVIEPNYDKIFSKYAYYALSKIELPNTGYDRKFKYLKRSRIPLPPLPTQKKIAAILDQADKLRQLNKQLIEKYDELSQSLFLEMFGDPVVNPKGWEKKKLKQLGVTKTGNTPPRNDDSYYNERYVEWIKTDNINTPNIYITKATEYLSEKGLQKGRFVEKGSLLVTCIAGSRKVIGNVAITDRKVAFNQQINSYTPEQGNILYYYHLFRIGKHHIQNYSTNGMKGIITKSKFETIDFINPPTILQNQFADRIQAIEAQKVQAQESLKKSDDLFNSLLQRAFKGHFDFTSTSLSNHAQ